mmetsp:Transcript_147/g.225  ORF Transcript_147/g.225 Transcript_147/m.225 type:complete len:383 (+) Transcript_147:67-1215(+)
MDAIITIIRNATACVKAMQLFPDSFLYDKTRNPLNHSLPAPFSDTTPIEVLMSFCQLYGCISLTRAGIRMVANSGVHKLRRINKLILAQSPSSTNDLASRIIDSSLKNEASAARRSIFMGVNVLIFGLSFIWLVALSWHFLDWIGGYNTMMWVFILFEVAYLPFLYYMVIDGNYFFAKAERMKKFSALLHKSSGRLGAVGGPKLVDTETYSWLVNGWTPFWSSETSSGEKTPSDEKDNQNLAKEVIEVDTKIMHLLSMNEQDVDEKEAKFIKQTIFSAADRLEKEFNVVKVKGWFEYIYLVLNCITFYGYLVGCVVFFFDEETSQPILVRNVKFGMDNQTAEWHGYYIAYIMVILDSVLRLSSPTIIGYLAVPKPSPRIKTD